MTTHNCKAILYMLTLVVSMKSMCALGGEDFVLDANKLLDTLENQYREKNITAVELVEGIMSISTMSINERLYYTLKYANKMDDTILGYHALLESQKACSNPSNIEINIGEIHDGIWGSAELIIEKICATSKQLANKNIGDLRILADSTSSDQCRFIYLTCGLEKETKDEELLECGLKSEYVGIRWIANSILAIRAQEGTLKREVFEEFNKQYLTKIYQSSVTGETNSVDKARRRAKDQQRINYEKQVKIINVRNAGSIGINKGQESKTVNYILFYLERRGISIMLLLVGILIGTIMIVRKYSINRNR